MTLQLWTVSNLQRLDYPTRRKIVFYAPLVESLDFHGVDPCTYTRAGTTTAAYRGGSKSIGANVPQFEYTGETQLGLWIASPVALRFEAGNNLNNANTVVWFEDRVPKSTPTQTNPFDSGGNWTGNTNIHLSHVAKANAVLSNTEINAIQVALLNVAQSIPSVPAPPVGNLGTFVDESPSGTRNGSNKIFTLSQNPDLGSLEIFWAGLYIKRVPSAPDTLEYTAGGTGNRTITMGSAPEATHDLTAHYVLG